MARSGPKCFFAACEMAFCRVSTRTVRSMPLSFATWSRIMFRLSVGMTCCCGAAMVLLRIVLVVGGAGLVVPVDEGGALAGQEIVLQRPGRVLARDRPGGGVLVLAAIDEREREARVRAARVLRVPRAERRLALAPGEEQDRLPRAEQAGQRTDLAP